MNAETRLLPPDALRGVRVGVSVSDSADLESLGLLEEHFRLALGEIAGRVLVLGGTLAYGGHLQPQGYTAFLAEELQRSARRDRPLAVCLSWSEHRRVPLSQLSVWKRELGLFGDLACLSPDGEPIDPAQGRSEDPVPENDPDVVARSLTGLRRYMGRIIQGRVLIGGKRADFQGRMPGLVEEAWIALEAGQPLFLVGGFGGVTLDMIRKLAPENAAWATDLRPAGVPDRRCSDALDGLADFVRKQRLAWFDNGLDHRENRRLSATHRPSEIASLICLGLGRLALEGRFDR